MPIKAILWDLGGVLLRTVDPAPREALAARLGTTRRELEQRIFMGEEAQRGQLGQIEGHAYWRARGREFGMDYDDFLAAWFGGDAFDHDLLAAIRAFKSNYTIALLSNAFGDLRQWLSAEEGFMETFDLMVISAEEGLMKPDPAIYTLTLDRLGVAADETAFIDDHRDNIEAAQALGIHAIQFKSREQTLRELATLLEGA